MLTHLKVSGFKNLVDVDIRFGPFTCIAGANGVGKSNLFDAIQFLSALADKDLSEAARSVRKSERGRTADIRSLFHQAGKKHDDEMSFEVEMIVPEEGVDDLGQKAKATITFLRYKLILSYRYDEDRLPIGSLEILHEALDYINASNALKHLAFPHSNKWQKSAVHGRGTFPFISTEGTTDNDRVIKLHQEDNSGRSKTHVARTLPRTVLSTANAADSPTALLARREMQSWRLLQLEPSALREPDEFNTKPGLRSDGAHLPATLYQLARSINRNGNHIPATWLYDQIANRLADLIDDIFAVQIDRDEKRQVLTLEVSDRSGTSYPARSLSDGTLRFLALAVMEHDPTSGGLICLEEPENGIPPRRIPAMLQLLEDIAVDVEEPVNEDNPLRQVIINTHSPVVVDQVPDSSLLIAELKETVRDGERFKRVSFSWLPDTWRVDAEPQTHPVARGKVLAYLKHVIDFSGQSTSTAYQTATKKSVKVGERRDLHPHFSINEP